MNTDKDYSTGAPVPKKPLWRLILNWPGTRMGWWSTGFFLAFVALLILFYALVGSGQRGGETFFSNVYLALSILAAGASAIVSGILAGIAVVRNRERSLLAFLAILLGLLVTIFVMGEVAFPH